MKGIFTPYGDKSKYSFEYQPFEPLDTETQHKYSTYYKKFVDTLQDIGVTPVQFKEIYRMIMAILLLGNVLFTTERSNTIVRNPEQIKSICQMIGCSNPNRIQQLLCVGVPPEGASHRRDYLAQIWYTSVVSYILNHINNYFRSRFGVPSPKAKIRSIKVLHVPSYDKRTMTPV